MNEWFEQAGRAIHQAVQTVIVCPIFGENFGSVHLEDQKVASLSGRSSAQRVRILNLPKVKSFRYGRDRSSMDVLFDKEQNANEALKAQSGRLLEAYADMVERVTIEVALQNVVVHTYADPDLFEVMVILRANRVIQRSDTCLLIPKRGSGLSRLHEARRSMFEDLRVS